MHMRAASHDSDAEHNGRDDLVTLRENVQDTANAPPGPADFDKRAGIAPAPASGEHNGHNSVACPCTGSSMTPIASGSVVLPDALEPLATAETDQVALPEVSSVHTCYKNVAQIVAGSLILFMFVFIVLFTTAWPDNTTAPRYVSRRPEPPSPPSPAPVQKPLATPAQTAAAECSNLGLDSLDGCCEGAGDFDGFTYGGCCLRYEESIPESCDGYVGGGTSSGGSGCSATLIETCAQLPSGYSCPGDICCNC